MVRIAHIHPERVLKPTNSAAFVRHSSADCETLLVTGEVDMANAHQFAEALEDMLRQPSPLVVDLRNCSYFDSSGLHVIMRAADRAQSGFSTTAIRGSAVHRILELTNLSERLGASFEPTVRQSSLPA